VLSSQNPAQHYECHVSLSLEEQDVLLKNKTPTNVWVLVDKDIQPALQRPSVQDVDGATLSHAGFEVTFMATTDHELDMMAKHQESGILPQEK